MGSNRSLEGEALGASRGVSKCQQLAQKRRRRAEVPFECGARTLSIDKAVAVDGDVLGLCGVGCA
jgi:ribosomal protein L18E